MRNTRDSRSANSSLRTGSRLSAKNSAKPGTAKESAPDNRDFSRPQAAVSYANQRVGIFIDVQNLYHSAKHLTHGRVNYHALLPAIVGNRQLIRALAYATKSDSPGEEAFLGALTHAGFELRLKELQIFPDGSKKSDWDVGLAVEAIRMAPALDVIVLVAGDGDYIPLLEYLRWGNGKLVEVVAFRKSASLKLQEAADKFIDIESIPNIILRGR